MWGANDGELQLLERAVGVGHLEVFGGDVDDLLALRQSLHHTGACLRDQTGWGLV